MLTKYNLCTDLIFPKVFHYLILYQKKIYVALHSACLVNNKLELLWHPKDLCKNPLLYLVHWARPKRVTAKTLTLSTKQTNDES